MKAALGQQMALPYKATGTAQASLRAPPALWETVPKLFLDPNLLRDGKQKDGKVVVVLVCLLSVFTERSLRVNKSL